jgi:hypothetical protein
MMTINIFERDYKNGTLSLAHIETTNHQDFIVDVISNESFKLELSGNYLCSRYSILAIINNNNYDLFMIDKVTNASEIYCKHILNIYNQKNKIDTYNNNLVTLINDFFKNNIDPYLNFPYITYSGLNIVPNFSTDKLEVTNYDIINYRDLIYKSIIKARKTFRVDVGSKTSVSFSLTSEDQTPIQINLNKNSAGFFAEIPEIPEIETSTNVTKFVVRTTLEKIDKTEVLVSEVSTSYYLLNDNTISNDFASTKRIQPPQHDCVEVFIKQKEVDNDGVITIESDTPPDLELLAEEKMLNTSQYSVSIEVFNLNNSINVDNLKLFQLYDFYTGENFKFRTLLTGYKRMKSTTELRFGLEREDVIFLLNKLKGGK